MLIAHYPFQKKDLVGVIVPHQDLLVIVVMVRKSKLLSVLVDIGALVE